MSAPDVFSTIQTIVAGWSGTAPVIWENEDFALPESPAEFVYVEVYDDVIRQDTIGAPQANEWLEAGMIYMHVMTRRGEGSSRARTLARDLSNLFREQPSNGVYFREMSIGAGEPGRSFGNYFAMTLTVAWDRRDVTDLD